MENEQLDWLAMTWLVSHANPALRLDIEDQLRNLTDTNRRFSREFFYAYFSIPGKIVGLHFIPGSDSYKNFGDFIVVVPCFSPEQGEELTNNVNERLDTYGLVMATDTNEKLNAQNRMLLSNTGFNTKHVMEIRYL